MRYLLKRTPAVLIALSVVLITALLFSSKLYAQQPEQPAQAETTNSDTLSLEDLKDYITQLRNSIVSQNENTKILVERLQQLEQQVLELSEKIDHPAPASQPIQKQEKQNFDPELEKRIAAERVENAQLIESAFEQRLITSGGLLMPAGKFSYEPGISYSNASVDRIVIDGFSLLPVLVIGDIVSEKVRRETITITNSFRAGLPHDFQLELQIPYGYEKQGITSGDNEHDSTHASGQGDISISLSHQLVKSSPHWPDTLLSLGWKSDTGQDPYRLTDSQELALGTGFTSTILSLTSVNISDPLAFHYGLSYTSTARDLKSIGYIKPGASLRLFAGTSMAINLDTSISYSFQLSYSDETEFNGSDISGSDYTTATLSFGLSRILSSETSVDFNIGIGLTEDAPDFQFTVSMPIRLN